MKNIIDFKVNLNNLKTCERFYKYLSSLMKVLEKKFFDEAKTRKVLAKLGKT